MQVKVWNDNVHPYSEKFRDRHLTIAPKDYIEMDEDEAEYFKSAFTFPQKDEQGRPDPKFFKMIRIEKPKVEAKADPLMNHATGKRAATPEELRESLAAVAHLLVKDEAAEAEARKREDSALKKENKELKARLAQIEEKLGIKADEKSL